MNTIIGLTFCILLGVMIKAQGIAALLWVPIGFVFGLFVTAQMVLPLILGLPRAIRLVSKRQMRTAVFGSIILTPMIWLVQLTVGGFLLGWFWPSAAYYLYNNAALNLGAWLGTTAIVLSPLSKKCRSDFRDDFDNSYHRFYTESDGSHPRDQYQIESQKQVEAAIRVASNLYLHTIPGAKDAPVPLQFSLSDSRYRYLIFCLSAAVTTALAYDEEKKIQPEALIKGCLHFATWTATENAQEYFDDPVSSQDLQDVTEPSKICNTKHW